MSTRSVFRELLGHLMPAIETATALIAVYAVLADRISLRDYFLPILVAVPFIVALANEIPALIRRRSDAQKIGSLIRDIDDMESRGLINLKVRRELISSILDSGLSSDEKLELQLEDSIRRHSDSLRSNATKLLG